MRKSVPLTLLFLAWMLLIDHRSSTRLNTLAAPLAGPTERASLRTGGAQGNNESYAADVSADGRYVVFESRASNLVDGDTNGVNDIFVHDRQSGITQRVSVHSNGTQGNFDSFAPAISGDGNIVAFYSWATNLVGGDNNNLADAFLHNRSNHTTEMVSVAQFGGNDVSFDPDPDPIRDLTDPARFAPPDVSADGRYIVFRSFASNLVVNDTNGESDIFRWDRISRVMERVSVDSNEVQANGASRQPSISDDGQRIAFVSEASNLVTGDTGTYDDVFLRDMGATTTQRISLAAGEAQGDSFDAAISGNGRFVAFSSLANNLVGGDFNNFPDVFLRDTQAQATVVVSIATNSAQANEWSIEASLTADGRYVAFQTRATNLVPGDPDGARDVFVRDRQANTTVRASIDTSGVIGNAASRMPVIAAGGRYVVFDSVATNLVSGDSNGIRDVFVHDLVTPVPPPPPTTLTVNYFTGAPGSLFAYSGANWAASSAVEIWINGVLVSNSVTTAGDGALNFVVRSQVSTAPGGYFVTVVQGGARLTAGFILRAGAPMRPASGSGPILDIPGGAAPYAELGYMPVIWRN